MRPYERRAANAYPYFKLATWDARNMMWRAGKGVQEDEAAARAKATRPGRYMIERFESDGTSVALKPFEVPSPGDVSPSFNMPAGR